jgi:hypothetical protein
MEGEYLGMHGATHGSWERDAIRTIFRELQKEHPGSAKNWRDMSRRLRDRCLEDPAALDAACDYIAKNFTEAQENYVKRAEAAATTRAIRSPEAIAERRAADAKAVESIKRQIALLNLPMANGKLARNCTGEELVAIGGKWVKVGKKIGATKILGQVMNEEEVQKAFE